VILLGLLAESPGRPPGSAVREALRPAGEAAWAPVRPEAQREEPAFQAFRDPVSGRFVAPAPELAARSAAVSGLVLGEFAAGELVERPTGTPAGGVGVELAGRFRSYLVATRDVRGEVRVECRPEAPGAAAGPGAPGAAGGSGESGR
jgi:hypothetical protein